MITKTVRTVIKQPKIINYHVEEIALKEGLSERTKKVCVSNSLDTLYKVLNYFLKYGNFRKIRNCGEKTNRELIALAEDYLAKYELKKEDLELTETELLFDRMKFYCYEHYGIASEATEQFRKQFHSHDFPFFKYLSLIISNILNEREYFIFENNFSYIIGKKRLTLQAIGDIYDITRERVRQIALFVPSKIQDVLQVFCEDLYFIKYYVNYKIDQNKEFLYFNEKNIWNYNRTEEINFTQKFYAIVFSSVFTDNMGVILGRQPLYRHYFLAPQNLISRYDFRQFYMEFEYRMEDRVEEDYKESLDDIIKQYMLKDDPELFEGLKPICKKIVTSEFKLKLDENDEIFFPRNTMKKISEYILEIMNEKARPMKLQEICDELTARKVKIPHNIESLRSSILSIKEVLAIGKTSTYSLKGWGNVKTGTIKNLVREYLEQYEDPKHIDEITEYVNLYRDTNAKNILSNLKLDKSDTFMFFKKGYIGLLTKDYQATSQLYARLVPLT